MHSLQFYSTTHKFSNFRYSILNDEKCDCENNLKGNKLEENLCFRKCQDGEDIISCGGNGTESIYETGSTGLSGPVKSLKVQDVTQDTITIAFDPPERIAELYVKKIKNMIPKEIISSFSSGGYEIEANVTNLFFS